MRFYTDEALRRSFDKKFIPEPNSGCWLWTAANNGNGYGVIGIARGKVGSRNAYAHRLSYEWAFGKIPDGMEIDHKCRVRCCVNPDHLEAVTHKVNMHRGETIAAAHGRKTHCYKGHEFTPENTIKIKNGRQCLECRRAYDRMRYPTRSRRKTA